MNLLPTDQPVDPLVTIVVVTFNSAEDLPDFFAALAAVARPTFEVIVVDNASTDNTSAVVQRCWPQARVINNPHNAGFGRACNQGAAQARGAYIHLLNPDVRVTPDYLEQLIQTCTNHPDIAILCPATLYPDTQLAPTEQKLTFQAALPGSALLITRSHWKHLGGFDETMFLYWEDTELCWRAWLQGWQVAVDSHCWVYHLRGTSSGFRRWDAELVQNSIYTHVKLLRWPRVARYAGQTFVKSIAKTMLGRWQVWRGWWWLATHMRLMLQQRAQARATIKGDEAQLEQLIDQHQRSTVRERRLRPKG